MSANDKKQPSEGFAALLGELDTMTKALPAADVADDKKIADAADDGDGDGKQKLDADGKPIADTDPMTKSFQVTLADGTVVEAEDGTELVKSLFARVDQNEDMIVKALGGTLNLVKSQGEQIAATNALVKSMQAEIAKLGNQGAGRKTLVNVHEQVSTLTKAMGQPPTLTPAEFMTKANAAFDAQKITGPELVAADVSIRQGFAVDQAVFNKVMA